MSKRILKGSEPKADVEVKASDSKFDFEFDFGDKPKAKPAEEPAPAPKPKAEPIPEAKPAPGAHLKPEVAETPAEEPAPAPKATKSTTKKAATKAAPAPEPEVKPVVVGVTAFSYDGPGKAYKYWNYKSRSYRLTPDIWKANQAGNGVWDVVWVWYHDGYIHHILDEEELELYCP